MLNPDEIDALFGIKEIVFFKNGLIIKRGARFPMNHFQPVPRKGVYEMSKKSKLKLTHIVANCDVRFASMFTLTYGDFFIPHDGRELKRQTNLLLTAFRKRFDCEYIWFLEFTTKKKRPHLHVISTVAPNPWDRAWLGQRWAKITVLDYYGRLLRANTEEVKIVEPIDQWTMHEEFVKVAKVHSHKRCWESIYKEDGATRYCLKYAAKEEQKLIPLGFHNVGRFWGTSRNVAPNPIGRLTIDENQTEEEIRAIISETFVGQFPLIPKYIFQKDALEFFTSRGMRLTEIIVQKDNPKNGNHDQTMIS